MRIAYFTNDLEFAKRFSMLLGKNDTDMIFEIIDVKSQILGLGDCELDIENYDLIVGDVGISADDLRFDLLISQDDKLLTLCEHYNNLVAAYRRKRGIRSMKPYGGQAKILYFCSSGGGSGKTTIALGVADELCRFHDKKVLYLCMEPFSGSDKYFEVFDRKKDMDEYLYLLFSKKEANLFDFLATDTYGTFAFCMNKFRNPFYEMTELEMREVLENLDICGQFDYIVCDGYLPFGQLEMMLTSSAYKICIVDDGKKESALKKMLSYFERGIYVQKDKLVKVKNFAEFEDESEDGTVFILRDSDCIGVSQSGMLQVNTDGDFGLGIKKLCGEVA